MNEVVGVAAFDFSSALTRSGGDPGGKAAQATGGNHVAGQLLEGQAAARQVRQQLLYRLLWRSSGIHSRPQPLRHPHLQPAGGAGIGRRQGWHRDI